MPRPGVMLSLSKLFLNLQTCFTDRMGHALWKWRLKPLLDLLRQLPTLEDLALEFHENSTFIHDDMSSTNDTLTVTTPSLKTVSLHWHAMTNCDVVYLHTYVPSLFKLLELENVKTFQFIIYSQEELNDYGGVEELPLFLDEHFEFFLGEHGRFPRLESFHLNFYSKDIHFFRLPASLLQNIKHLSLNINVSVDLKEHSLLIENENDTTFLPLPHLQTLTLINCDDIRIDSVRSIINAVKAGGNWENFQQLVVDDCRYLSQSWVTSKLQDMVGPGKLTVYPLTRIF
ncbi:hypothetical protein SCHPADRAFT_910599 [Schizopora paradoxa]|uniref:F-box domain-containing protein n=1 Tax=Schizopora paradoxa TaxID=27342 RepID=A0A0H2RMG4_9AGAM|nr:hypothetical protein SCHPADRAFT_910599 [Schizopora paradoxa]